MRSKGRFVFFVCASKIQPPARNARGCQVKSVFPLSGLWSHAPAKMVQPGKPFTRRVNLKVDKLYYGISIGGINSYYSQGRQVAESNSVQFYIL